MDIRKGEELGASPLVEGGGLRSVYLSKSYNKTENPGLRTKTKTASGQSSHHRHRREINPVETRSNIGLTMAYSHKSDCLTIAKPFPNCMPLRNI